MDWSKTPLGPIGNSGKNSVIHRHTFSPGTISRHISSAENSIASFEPANTGAGLDNHTGKFPTKQDTTARFCPACPADENLRLMARFVMSLLFQLVESDPKCFPIEE